MFQGMKGDYLSLLFNFKQRFGCKTCKANYLMIILKHNFKIVYQGVECSLKMNISFYFIKRKLQ